MWHFLSLALAQAPCETPTDNASLASTLDEALAFYGDLDEDHFRLKLLEASAAVHCLDEPVQREVAALFHRLNGLDAFSHRDLALADQHFAAARAADPTFSFSTDLIPTQSPIREHYRALQLRDLQLAQLPPPAEGSVLLDGKLGLGWRRNLPSLFQRTDASGTIVQNVVLIPNADVPSYPTLEPQVRRERNLALPLLVGAGVALAASGALYGASLASGSKVRNMDPLTRSEGEAIQVRTNALALTSAGVLVVGVGLGIGAAVTGGF